MLHASGLSDEATAEITASSTPTEYLYLRQRTELAATCHRWNTTLKDAGLEFHIDGLSLFGTINNIDKMVAYAAAFDPRIRPVTMEGHEGRTHLICDLSDHHLLAFAQSLTSQITGVLPKDLAERLTKVPIGLVPSQYWNAGAEFVPSGGDIITLNLGLENLAAWNLFALEKGRANSDQESINEMGHCACLITGAADLNYALGEFGAHGFGSEGVEQSTKDKYFKFVYSGQLAWILLHEIMHIVRGHTDALRKGTIRANADESGSVERIHEMELEADVLTLPCLFSFAESVEASPLAVIDAVVLALRCIQFAERTSGRAPKLHPPAAARIANVLRYLPEQLQTTIDEWSQRGVFMAFGPGFFGITGKRP
jgi:hypothetical protein